MLGELRRGWVLLRIALCGITSLILWGITQSWYPPRDFREEMIPPRDLIARTEFSKADDEATQRERERARGSAVAVYDHDPSPVSTLQATLQNDVTQLLGAEEISEVDKGLWADFSPPLAEGTPPPTAEEKQEQFAKFRKALTAEDATETFKQAIAKVFAPYEQHGLIKELPPEHDANKEQISIRPLGTTGFEQTVPVGDVLVENAANTLQRQLAQELPLEVADRVFAWVNPRLPVTLRINLEATREEQDKAAEKVEQQYQIFAEGSTLAVAGEPISEVEMELLELEYQQELANQTYEQLTARSLATLGMYIALFTVGGFFVYKLDPTFVEQLPKLVTLLVTILATVATMLLIHNNQWRAEVIPLLLFGMTIAVASRQDLALLLSAAITLVGVTAIGHGLGEALILLATTTGAILVLDSVRTRSKLLMVGCMASMVAFFTTMGVQTLAGQPPLPTLQLALMVALWSIIAGSLMTVLLPLVERVFNVQTDLSLLELGDPAHSLLQELIRRAPGTYNHSITVASLAEAATEAIGGRGLLVRVGAYFHDIGKMLKPGYFIENQGQGGNRHDTLAPAMSTLVIIAHVKDGADLARQHNLPECIVDFIQQHHGTTLVEYFYRQAAVRSDADPDAAEVDESSFRYPGPKPQTKEAGVLMLSDAVESASRVLVEPTPSRIENLVEELTQKRLADGQFDECGLTLQEVRKIGDSLVKSLTAVYHGRVKYPDQETA